MSEALIETLERHARLTLFGLESFGIHAASDRSFLTSLGGLLVTKFAWLPASFDIPLRNISAEEVAAQTCVKLLNQEYDRSYYLVDSPGLGRQLCELAVFFEMAGRPHLSRALSHLPVSVQPEAPW